MTVLLVVILVVLIVLAFAFALIALYGPSRHGTLKGMKLSLRRLPDPVLTADELDFIEDRLTSFINNARQQMEAGLVSESVIHGRRLAESARVKVRLTLTSYNPKREWRD